MNTSGEAADQVVRMSLEVGEAALKITGAGAKQLAVILYAVLKEQKKTKGRARLETLVRSGKPLTVYSVKESDLKQFVTEAKRYGILYCAVRNPYHQAFFYCVGISDTTRRNVERIFDFEKGRIKPAGLHEGWQTGGSIRLTRLAFNLWNGYTEKGDERMSTPYEIFDCGYAPYFFEAIRLKYPDYCRELPTMKPKTEQIER